MKIAIHINFTTCLLKVLCWTRVENLKIELHGPKILTTPHYHDHDHFGVPELTLPDFFLKDGLLPHAPADFLSRLPRLILAADRGCWERL